MKDYTIPRGIKIRETVAFGLNGKQVLYLGLGLAGALGVFALPIPLDFRIAGGVMSSAGSVLFSLAKRHGQDLDQYVWNSVKYPLRNKEWDENAEKNPITINFHARQSSTV